MIEKVRIQRYRLFDDVIIRPHTGLNVIVGDNESGNVDAPRSDHTVSDWQSERSTGARGAEPLLVPSTSGQAMPVRIREPVGATLPLISIEVFLCDADNLQPLRGRVNSLDDDVPGVVMEIAPATECATELEVYLAERPSILPVEYYLIEWRSFADSPLRKRPKELAVSFIDSRTLRSVSGIDYYMREILSEYLLSTERAKISIAHRMSRVEVSKTHLTPVSEQIAKEHGALHDRPVGLAMDQSASNT